MRYLCRQGLSIRGSGDESYGNLCQLLYMIPESSSMAQAQKNVYTSVEIQNEMVKVMGLHILREITKGLQNSSFLTVMADETTDPFE